MDKKIIKLENNKEYFMISSLNENNIDYLLLINVDNESDVKIVKKIKEANEEYIIEVNQGNIYSDLKMKFKNLIDSEKNNYN